MSLDLGNDITSCLGIFAFVEDLAVKHVFLDVGDVFIVFCRFVQDFKPIGVKSVLLMLVNIHNMLDVSDVLLAAETLLDEI